MPTQCNTPPLHFQALGRRRVEAAFNGGMITSDAGALLLREVEARRGIIKRFAACFTDHRDPARIEHTVEELLAQRIFALALGYEDLNDHDRLRHDVLLATLVGKDDPTGKRRKRTRDQGCALAGKSTLNRLERTPEHVTGRYHKIRYEAQAIERFFVEVFLDAYPEPPDRIILDLDATDDVLHGEQEGRFFHGYYGHYCYLPLYIFSRQALLCATLRRSNIDASAGSLAHLQRIIAQIRERWPTVWIIVRGDSGFAREELMAWCEAHEVDYLFGLAKNARLLKRIDRLLERVRKKALRRGEPVRQFKELRYRTLSSWTRKRRVVAKAEYLLKGKNPRFVVTSLSKQHVEARALYEDWYCARGEMENRIKEQQLDLFSDRTSCQTMRSNQLRLWLSSVAYVLLEELRRVGLRGTEMARAQAGSIRTKLLKIGAQVVVSVRRVLVRLSSAYPYAGLFAKVLAHLEQGYVLRC